MPTLPHDVADLHLAPVVLAVDARLEELAVLAPKELVQRVALESNLPDWTPKLRVDGVLETVRHCLDLHGWELAWDPRGLRLTHDEHTLVLGVPASVTAYVDGAEPLIASHVT